MALQKKAIPAFKRPGHATAIDGEVTLHGVGNLGISMTPDAAETTAQRIIAASKQARKLKAKQG
jgi:Zn-dependent alcohol dehydrogenase